MRSLPVAALLLFTAACSYRVSVAYAPMPPPSCMPSNASPTELFCPPPQSFNMLSPVDETLCPTSLVATADLALPPVGDVTLTIPLTQ